MELPKYPTSCASRAQPPAYVDVDLEQQRSTDLPAYGNGTNQAGATQSTQSNNRQSELYEPYSRYGAQ